MLRTRSIWTTIMVLLTLAGLMALTSCGPSKEKKQMIDFLAEYSKAVEAYAELTKKADKEGMTELAAKIESLISRWSDIKNEAEEAITPQVLDKLDNEFKATTQKYKALAISG